MIKISDLNLHDLNRPTLVSVQVCYISPLSLIVFYVQLLFMSQTSVYYFTIECIIFPKDFNRSFWTLKPYLWKCGIAGIMCVLYLISNLHL